MQHNVNQQLKLKGRLLFYSSLAIALLSCQVTNLISNHNIFRHKHMDSNMSSNSYNFDHNQSSRVDIPHKPFNLSYSYNQPWINDEFSRYQLIDSSQSHFNQRTEMDDSTTNSLPDKSGNFKEELLPKPFNLPSSYNESWIEELVSKFRLFNSSQHHFNQSMAIKKFVASLRPNTSGNCQE